MAFLAIVIPAFLRITGWRAFSWKRNGVNFANLSVIVFLSTRSVLWSIPIAIAYAKRLRSFG